MEIKELFEKYNLVTNTESKPIRGLLNEDYNIGIIKNPQYQRNFIWTEDKQTYLIDSILLGVTIPPLVFFEFKETLEIIDGRQRFETIERFIRNKFKLKKKSLSFPLQNLHSKTFSDLDKYLQKKLHKYNIRIVRFSIQGNPTEEELYRIKIEIFKRYNVGITPIKKVDIFKAKHINSKHIQYFIKHIKSHNLFNKFKDIFAPSKQLLKDEEIGSKILYLLALNFIKISEYSAKGSQKEEEASKFFQENLELFDLKDIEDNFRTFIRMISILDYIKTNLPNEYHNRYIFETILRYLYLLEDNYNREINISDFNNKIIFNLKEFVSLNYKTFFSGSYHYQNHLMNRYMLMEKYFNKEFSVDLSVENNFNEEKEQQNYCKKFFINTSQEMSMSVSTFIDMIREREFYIRPIYQRGEVITKVGSSRIIESILLGIQLPTIFLYEDENGNQEVIDGQQRLTSILGFIGQEIIDTHDNFQKTNKHKFKLVGLEALQELNGLYFENLTKSFKRKITNFAINSIIIKKEENPDFDPIEMFIRLNNKPYPIKQDSFELWNSYINQIFISKVKSLNNKINQWFFINSTNNRMQNEELLTTLIFLEHLFSQVKDELQVEELFSFYFNSDKVSIRMRKQRSNITEFLKETDESSLIKRYNNIVSFIRKVETLIYNKDTEQNDKSEYLKSRFMTLLARKNHRRTLQDFYPLWLILVKITKSQIIENRESIFLEINKFFANIQEKENDSMDISIAQIESIWNKYSIDKRRLKLSENEKNFKIKAQNNKCPECLRTIYIGESDLVADHIRPLAKGGKDSIENIQILHSLCNNKKYTKIT